MTESSPSDLAVAFRSIPRRLREARGDLSDAEVDDLVTQIDGHLAAVARSLSAAPDPASIADAIEAMPPARWDEDLLDDLRRRTLDVGRVVRQVEARAAD
jgi:hypothetical protein